MYRGTQLSNDEINLIQNSLKNKVIDLPNIIAFSKTFLSFSKDPDVAKKFLRKNNRNNDPKVFFELEKDDNIDYSLSTHSDIENISFLPQEREVLFFPFSSFEIKSIESIIIDFYNVYKINLKYLGEYVVKEFEEDEKEIPNSLFAKTILSWLLWTELCPPKRCIKILTSRCDLIWKQSLCT